MPKEQMQLFDGDTRKELGIARVMVHTPESYRFSFEAHVSAMPSGHRFTSENVTRHVGQPPSHPNAVGALINGLARMGLIRKTGDRVKAQRPNQHSAMLEVWVRT